MNEVWVVHTVSNWHPTIICATQLEAQEWILKHKPQCVLTKYIIGEALNPEVLPEHYHYIDDEDFVWLQQRLENVIR